MRFACLRGSLKERVSAALVGLFWGRSMTRPYSSDLRERVVEAGASRRKAAERFEIAPSSAITWLQRWYQTGSVAEMPTEGSVSRLEEHATCRLALVGEQPNLTLEEVVEAMYKQRIASSRTAVWLEYQWLLGGRNGAPGVEWRAPARRPCGKTQPTDGTNLL
jgi:transposase